MPAKVAFDHKYLQSWLTSYTDIDLLKKEAKEAFTGINEKTMFKKAHMITAFLDHVVTIVEKAAVDFSTLQGVDEPDGKKKLDLAVKFLDDLIDLPWYAEWADKAVIKLLLSMAVQALNNHVGDSWRLEN
jgi:hypothetical protein